MPHLAEIRPGTWRVRVYAGKDWRGRQIQKSRTFTASGPQQARRKAVTIAGQLVAEKNREARMDGTVARLVDEWAGFKIAQGEPAYTTYRRASILRQITADLGDIPLHRLTAQHLDTWYLSLAKPYELKGRTIVRSKSTINHYHRVMSSMLRQAWKWGKVDANVALLASPPSKGTAKAATPPPVEAVKVLIGTATPDLRMAAYLAAATGARRGELMALRWSDLRGGLLTISRSLVDVTGKTLDEKAPKSGLARTIALDADTLHALELHRLSLHARSADYQGGRIFPDLITDPTGETPRRASWLSAHWKAHCAKAGAKIRFHDLRHFHASQLIDMGVPLTTVSERLGHSLVSTTANIYSHALKASDQAAADAIGSLLALPAG